jgi:AraC family transcriptional regulator
MKMPPGRYILDTRINRACTLLETTDQRISDIAHQVGFCDQSHFIRTFKKIREMMPSAYRRRHRHISR